MLVVVAEYSGTTHNRMQFSEQLNSCPCSLEKSTIAPGTQSKHADVYLTNWKCSCLGRILLAAVDGPWSHYSRACSVGSQGEKVCSSQCSLPCLDCHFYPPHGGGPGGMSDTILLTLLPVSSGAGIPPSSSHLPKMLQGECHPLDFARPASLFCFCCVQPLRCGDVK